MIILTNFSILIRLEKIYIFDCYQFSLITNLADKTSENSPKGFQSTSNKHVENGADTDQDTSDQEGHHNDQHNHHQPR